MASNFVFYLLSVLLIVLISGADGYSASGNKILDPSGNVILLRGVDRPSLEWSQTGESLSLADYALMKAWGANVVRVALNQDFWLSSSAYQSTVKQQAVWIKACGMGVIFDLHWNQGGQQNMADENSPTFWTQMANIFKNDPWVIFELYNEPHDITWDQWRNGGGGYSGMQQLYQAVRATGANNLVLAGGLNWAFDLSGVSSGYALTGFNIAYATHPYDYPGKQSGNWDYSFGTLSATAPVVMTEFGEYCSNDGYVAALLSYAQTKQISWTAWAWYPSDCSFPSIISDYSGTPSSVGAIVKQYLGGSGIPSSPITVSSSGTSSGSTASGTVAPASGAFNIYINSLASGFVDWSWSTAYSLSDTTNYHSAPSSIRMAVQKYEGIYFHETASFQLGAYDHLQFYIYAPTFMSKSNLAVNLYGGATPVQVGAAVTLSTDISANVWTLITIPLSSFGAASTSINGVGIASKVSANAGNVWIDDIVFVPLSSSSGSTAAPTPAPTQAPTAAPTQAPTSAPTPAPTAAPTAAPTQAPTAAPTSRPTFPPPPIGQTQRPIPTTTAPTVAATPAPNNPTSPPSSGACGAANIVITQTITNSWSTGSGTMIQYGVVVSSTCASQTLVGLTLTSNSASAPYNSWGATASGSTITFPSYLSVTQSSPYNQFGYQATTQYTFTAASWTFQ